MDRDKFLGKYRNKSIRARWWDYGKNAPLSTNQRMSYISPKSGTLSTIIRSYKSAVTKGVHQYLPDFAWQRRFYDHIIRNNRSYYRIKKYIKNNPGNWEKDNLRHHDGGRRMSRGD